MDKKKEKKREKKHGESQQTEKANRTPSLPLPAGHRSLPSRSQSVSLPLEASGCSPLQVMSSLFPPLLPAKLSPSDRYTTALARNSPFLASPCPRSLPSLSRSLPLPLQAFVCPKILDFAAPGHLSLVAFETAPIRPLHNHSARNSPFLASPCPRRLPLRSRRLSLPPEAQHRRNFAARGHVIALSAAVVF